MPDSSIPQKQCTGPCKRELPATTEFFHCRANAPDGLRSECKACRRESHAKYRAKNAERIRKQKHDSYWADPEKARAEKRADLRRHPNRYREYAASHAEQIAETKRAWRKANPEKARKHKADSQKRNRKSANERTKRWAKRNPDKVLAGVHRRRARKLKNGGSYTQADIDLQLRSQKGRCWHCGKPLSEDQTIDHLIPLSRGGSNAPRNIVITHLRCNLSKGAKLPHEWNGRLL